MKFARILFSVLTALVLAACVSMGSARFSLDRSFFLDNYPRIKSVMIEEAANNGFGALTSEIKPSEYNDWKGQLFFQLKTANGTDQLFVEFSKGQDGVAIWVHGAGTRSNPDSASKAIQARLEQMSKGAASQTKASVATNATQPTLPKLKDVPVQSEKQASSAAPAADLNQMTPSEIQSKLISLGYLSGKADGIFGKSSTAALTKFQRESGIPATGKPDVDTINRLRSATKK